jgi:hypothetical protein
MTFTRDQIKQAVLRKGYQFFEDGDYNVNIIGIRNNAPGKKVTNVFDDWITLTFKQDGIWQFYIWPATTDPGKAPMLLGNNGIGTARVVPGQYLGSHMIRLHRGQYEAVCQKGNISVYRDADRDLEFDTDKITTADNYGINIHKAGRDSTWIDNWSHGCQVFKRSIDFEEFMRICKKAAKIHGNSFSYTLIETKDIV